MPKSFPLRSAGFNPFGELIGLDFTSCQDGTSTCVLEVTETLMNPHRVLHGAVVYALGDTGMGGALYSTLNDDETCATISMTVNYLRPVKGGKLECNIRVTAKKGTFATLESVITNDGVSVAKATGVYAITKVK